MSWVKPTSPMLLNYVCPSACDGCLSSARFWLRFVDLEAVSWSTRKSKRSGENAVLKGSMVCLGPRCLLYINVRIVLSSRMMAAQWHLILDQQAILLSTFLKQHCSNTLQNVAAGRMQLYACHCFLSFPYHAEIFWQLLSRLSPAPPCDDTIWHTLPPSIWRLFHSSSAHWLLAKTLRTLSRTIIISHNHHFLIFHAYTHHHSTMAKNAASALQYGMVPKEQKQRNHLRTTIIKHAFWFNKPVIPQY